MKKIILITLVCFGNFLTAQNSLAKIEYSYAEEAFTNKDYNTALDHLEEVKSILGSTNARVMFLEIICRSNNLPEYEDFYSNFKILKKNTPYTTNGNPYAEAWYQNSTPQNLSIINSNKEIWQSYKHMLPALQSDLLRDMFVPVINKLKNGQDVTKEDFNPEKYIELNKKSDASQINSWLESVERINQLCDTYIQNFEEEAPLDKLKQIYEIKKQYRSHNLNNELVKSSWKVLNNKDYENALVKFNELEQAGIDSKSIVKKIQKIQSVDFLIKGIENNMVFVQGNQNEKGEISDLYVSKYEITNKQYFDMMNLEYDVFDDNEKQTCDDCPPNGHFIDRSNAEKFISDLNTLSDKKYRLPTKEEWFWFATGGLNTTDEERGKNKEKSKNLTTYAWFYENVKPVGFQRFVQPVGLKLPNELGLYDVWGNVAELTSTNAVGGSYSNYKKNFIKGSSYSYSYEWDNESSYRYGIRLVLTVHNSQE